MANTTVTAIVTIACETEDAFERACAQVAANPDATGIVASELARTITFTLVQKVDL